MTRLVLGLFGLLYLALGIWCLAAPETTSRKVGLQMLGGAGRSEFLTVYGGLEVALGLFFLLCLGQADLHRAGLLLALISSAGLAITRAGTLVLVSGVPRSTLPFFAAEVAMTAVAAVAFLRAGR